MANKINVKATYLNNPNLNHNTMGIKILGVGNVESKKINIALLIDTSGSMEGIRINSVKKTLRVLVDILEEDDIITLIGFSSNEKIILSKEKINNSNKNSIIEEIDNLKAEGGTNLECAISCLGSLEINDCNAIVILTDGDVNQGVKSVNGIYSLVKSYIPSKPIYTLGYGDNHNSKLMKALSTKTHGAYSFIQNEISLPESLGDMIGGLKSEISSNVSIKFPDDWKCIEPIAEEGNTFSVGSVISNKPMWVMLNIPKGSENKQIELNYEDGNQNKTIIFNSDESLEGIEDSKLACRERIELIEQVVRCEVGKIMNEVESLIEGYESFKAKEILIKTIENLNNSEAKDRPFVISTKAQLEDILSEIKDAVPNQSLIRLVSNTGSNYGLQRGVTGGGGMFTSPIQERFSNMMSQRYEEEDDEDPSTCHSTTKKPKV